MNIWNFNFFVDLTRDDGFTYGSILASDKESILNYQYYDANENCGYYYWGPVGTSAYLKNYRHKQLPSYPIFYYEEGHDPYYYVYGPNQENFCFDSKDQLVSWGVRTLELLTNRTFVTESFINRYGLDSTGTWKYLFTGPGRNMNKNICADRGGNLRLFLKPTDSLNLNQISVPKAIDKIYVIPIDSSGAIGNPSIFNELSPSAYFVPVANSGFIEYTFAADSGNANPGFNLTLRRTSQLGETMWQKQINIPSRNPVEVHDLKCDSLGTLLMLKHIIKKRSAIYYDSLVKYEILAVDTLGDLILMDTSTNWNWVKADNFKSVGISRISKNKFAISFSSNESFQFQNRDFYIPRSEPHRGDRLHSSYLFIFSNEQSLNLDIAFEGNFCSGDSIKIALPRGIADTSEVYTLQISDSSGSFQYPTNLASGSGTFFKAPMPSHFPASKHYQLRFIAQDQQVAYRVKSSINYMPALPRPSIFTVGGSSFCEGNQVKLFGQNTFNGTIEWQSEIETTWGHYTVHSPKDTLTANSNGRHFLTSTFGSCVSHSDTITTRSISSTIPRPGDLGSYICSPSPTIRLTKHSPTGVWSGPFVASDTLGQYFQSEDIADTILLYYKDYGITCEIDTGFQVILLAKPVHQFVRDSILCVGNSIVLPNTQLPNTQWRLSNNTTITNFQAIQPGSYRLWCRTSDSYCSTYSDFTVTVLGDQTPFCQQFDSIPEMSLLLNASYCGDESVVAYLKNKSFQLPPESTWALQLSNPQGRFDTLRTIGVFNTPTFQFQMPNNIPESNAYRLRIKCSDPDTIFYVNRPIEIRTKPAPPTIESIGPLAYCSNNINIRTRFFASGQYPSRWQTTDSSWLADTIVPMFNKVYSAKSFNGACVSNTSQSKGISIDYLRRIIMTSRSAMCVPTSSHTLRASVAGIWSGPQVMNSGVPTFIPTIIDDTLMVRFAATYGNNNGCAIDTSFRIIQFRTPTTPQFSDTSVCRNGGLFLLPFRQWTNTWTGNHIANNMHFDPILADSLNTLRVLSANSICRTQGTLIIRVIESPIFPCIITDFDISLNNAFSVFPNPAHNKIYLEGDLKEVENNKINLYNASGKLVLSLDRYEATGIDIAHLANGLYLLQYQAKSGNKLVKWIKE